MITPDYINQIIDFFPGSNSGDWKYDTNADDMRNLQIKGAAHIFNLLSKYKVALLADEVGMGKTIQSLAVATALLHEKPTAKILILAPREEIVRNWEKEYLTFIKHHYRFDDNKIRNTFDKEPVKPIIYCPNLYHLVHEVNSKWGQIFVGKISSFSSLLAPKEIIPKLKKLGIKKFNKINQLRNNKEELNKEVIKLLKERILNNSTTKDPYFDLVIIDEAHYFRRKESNSLRVQTANIFFGDPNNKIDRAIADKVLLLTATPNHSSSNDISNIVSYFTTKFNDSDYKKILETICVRRLRRLSEHSLNKYNYREEIESQSDFLNNPLGESFFALYQYQLAKKVFGKTGKNDRGVSRMLKYIEGVEFIPFEKNKSDGYSEEINVRNDFKEGEDTEILINLSEKFRTFFKTHPSHPKYEKIVSDLTEDRKNEKALVFVRRIPSVFEISKRVSAYYDKAMWDSVEYLKIKGLNFENLNRRSFNKLIVDKDEEDIEIGDNQEENIIEDEIGKIPESKVLNLFKIIKGSEIERTHASNFRLRFSSSRPGIFGVFFSPAADYLNLPYKKLSIYKFQVGSKQIDNYNLSAFISRCKTIEPNQVASDLKNIVLPKSPIESKISHNQDLDTLFTIFWRTIEKDNSLERNYKQKLVQVYSEFNFYEKEALSKFIEKGTLNASNSVVWLYNIYLTISSKPSKADKLYSQFTKKVAKELKQKLLYKQIQDSILHFKDIYTKVFAMSNNKKLVESNWNSFNNAQPIYPYNADNSNKSVLNAFNTPFYPDILVATSVLQEGVNLQYFCKNVYHYGMAWTPGDNEQRIGRVDRMFSNIERQLNQDPKATLPIYYPYLKDTIDEEHLARFIKRKFKAEKLIDECKTIDASSDNDILENHNSDWRDFLRKPSENSIHDPFPALVSHFKNIKHNSFKFKELNLEKIVSNIVGSIQSIEGTTINVYSLNNVGVPTILIDTFLKNNRKQPVIIEFSFDPIGTSFFNEAVVCLKMKTPLAPLGLFKHFRDNFYCNKYLMNLYSNGIKLCFDNTQEINSFWSIYMASELPLFIDKMNNNPLSKDEIQLTLLKLINCADDTEQIILNNQDINVDQLKYDLSNSFAKVKSILSKARGGELPQNWKVVNGYIVNNSKVKIDATDFIKESMILNHKYKFVKSVIRKNALTFQVAHLVKDVQFKEVQLLERHLSYAINKQMWNR